MTTPFGPGALVFIDDDGLIFTVAGQRVNVTSELAKALAAANR